MNGIEILKVRALLEMLEGTQRKQVPRDNLNAVDVGGLKRNPMQTDDSVGKGWGYNLDIDRPHFLYTAHLLHFTTTFKL